MEPTAPDLETALTKMISVGDLLRSAREELKAHEAAGGAAAEAVPQSVWTKIHAVLLQYNDVVRTVVAHGYELGSRTTPYDFEARRDPDIERKESATHPTVKLPAELPRLGYVQRAHCRSIGDCITLGPDVIEVHADCKSFTGTILAVGEGAVVQGGGRGSAVVHVGARLSHEPKVGEPVCIMYRDGRGHVVELCQRPDLIPPRN